VNKLIFFQNNIPFFFRFLGECKNNKKVIVKYSCILFFEKTVAELTAFSNYGLFYCNLAVYCRHLIDLNYMIKHIFAATMCLLYCLPQCSFAQKSSSNAIDFAFKKCLDKDTTVANVGVCAYIAYGKWDKELTKEYNQLLRQVSAVKDKEALKSAELQWISFRDAEFHLYDNIFNKPGRRFCLLRAQSRINLVKTRLEQIKEYRTALENKNRSR
jgi:uncharacterized protein YecT (DUF1311 family)